MLRRFICASLFAFTYLSACNVAVQAEEATYEITVEAGKYDRQSVPMRCAVPVSAAHAEANNVRLTGGDDAIPAQLTARGLQAPPANVPMRTLQFILPSLKAGETAKFKAVIGGEEGAATKGFVWNDTVGEYAELKFEKPVLRYMYHEIDDSTKESREQTYKPFHHVYSPDGSTIITKGPGGKYTHHRGLYFGFNRVSYGDDFAKKCDVWHCSGKAFQQQEKFLGQEEGFVVGRHKLQIGWHGAEGEKFAEETREVSVYNAGIGHFIDFVSQVKTVAGPIKLDGDPQHAGFHFRAHNDVNDKTAKQTYYLRPSGKGEPGETKNWSGGGKADPTTVNEPWKVCSFMLDDKRYSVLRIDHPENSGEDRSSERDYGRFGGYFEYEITPDAPLKVKYRVIVKDGEFTAEEAERLAADFVSPPKYTVKKL